DHGRDGGRVCLGSELCGRGAILKVEGRSALLTGIQELFVSMLQIRPFRLGDEEAVIDIWNLCNLVRPWNDPVKDIQRKLKVNSELFLVGVEVGPGDETIVATVMAGYEGHRGWINYLAVHP